MNDTTTKDLPRTGLLTRSQFQSLLGIKSRTTIYSLIKNNEFPEGYSLGGNLRVWRAEDIWHWIDTRFPRQEWRNQKIKNGLQ